MAECNWSGSAAPVGEDDWVSVSPAQMLEDPLPQHQDESRTNDAARDHRSLDIAYFSKWYKPKSDEENQTLVVGYVASIEQFHIRDDDQAWVDILRSWGHVVNVVPWDDPNVVWKEFHILVTRMTYHHLDPEGFRRWLNSVECLPHVTVLNAVAIHRWNQDKRYLQQLEIMGIPVIPTVWLTRGADVTSALGRSSLLGQKDLIIKPTISSMARGLCRVDGTHVAEVRELVERALHWSDVMIQPFITSIESCGEIRCVFLGQKLSHVIQKLPLPGDFRTNLSNRWKPLEKDGFPAYDAVVKTAQAALAAFLSLAFKDHAQPSQLLFAAVDLALDADGQPLLIELEMTDPCLYLESRQRSLSSRFAELIASCPQFDHPEQPTRLRGLCQPIFPWQSPEILFVREVLRNPSANAIISDSAPPVTYLELCKQAMRISEHVSKHRCTSIAILCRRKPILFSAIMGCIFSRLPYLVLNDSIPAERTRTMLKLSNIKYVLCDGSDDFIHKSIEPDIEVHILNEIRDFTSMIQVDQLYELLLRREPIKERINNFIFTSGSTGAPKGIRIRHQAVANVVQHFIANVIQHTSKGNVIFAHTTNTNFDISAIPFFVTLAVGGTIALASENCMRDPVLLKRFLYSSQSNYMLATTSQYRLLIESGWLPSPDSLCIQAGEVLTQKVASHVLDRGGLLWNFYGPSETTIWSTGCRITDASEPISIGLPIWNTEVMFLDSTGDFSDQGELCIAGHGLGQYISQQSTHRYHQQKTLPGHMPEGGGIHLYHTGDLAHFVGEQIIYRGRLDSQIKIAGQRVELQEIETAIRDHPKVSETVVKYLSAHSQEGQIVAFIAPAIDIADIRGMLANCLTRYMIPSKFVFVQAFPLNSSGKVDGRALIEQYVESMRVSTQQNKTVPYELSSGGRHDEVYQHVLLNVFRQKLRLEEHQLSAVDSIFDFGATSIVAIEIAAEISTRLDLDVSVADIFENPTASRLETRLRTSCLKPHRIIPQIPTASMNSVSDIAIIGCALRCPSASSPEKLWDIVMKGEDTVAVAQQLQTESSSHWVNARTSLSGSLDFDRVLFGMTETQAQFTDPQHRLFLECAYEALESSGYVSNDRDIRIGVFGAATESTYYRHFLANADRDQATAHLIQTGTDVDYISSLAAFKLDLRGPAVTVGTACSSSSVAIALACDSLRAGRCDIAIAGGASVRFPACDGYSFSEGYIHSHDGRCRPFDEHASGTVMTDGVGVVVLKRQCASAADGDDVLAVIKGYAMLNDGSQKASFQSPSIQGQARTISDALSDAGIPAHTISYVETHGTGTSVGDAIEFQAITEALGSQNGELCHMGAVKANIGHTNSASGVFGLIKLSLCMRHKLIPPLANFSGNSKLEARATRLRFPLTAASWEVSDESVRRTGLALSTGFGGTNVAFVLEEIGHEHGQSCPTILKKDEDVVILPLSAATISALKSRCFQLATFLKDQPQISLSDVALTLRERRQALSFRTTFVVKSSVDAVTRLQDINGLVPTRAGGRPALLFVFPGQGILFTRLGASLWRNSAVFRKAFEDCLKVIDQYGISKDVRDILFRESKVSESADNEANEPLPTEITQPFLFALEYSIAQLLCATFGVPDGVIGHSFGEIVAACVSGAISLQAALSFAVTRGRLSAQLPEGDMLAVRMSRSRCYSLASELGLSVAAENDEDSFVLSGDIPTVKQAQMKLQLMNVAVRHLDVKHAFHSKAVDSILDGLLQSIAPFESSFKPPNIRLFSTVTGKKWESGSVIPTTHWLKHARRTVLFADAMRSASSEFPNMLAIEIGSKMLSKLIERLSYEKNSEIITMSIFSHLQSDVHESLLVAAGKMWESGYDDVIKQTCRDWPRVGRHGMRRVTLPTYPFEKATCVYRQPVKTCYVEIPPQPEALNKLTPSAHSDESEIWPDIPALVAVGRWEPTDIASTDIAMSPNSMFDVQIKEVPVTGRLQSLIKQAMKCADLQPYLNARAMKYIQNALQRLGLTHIDLHNGNPLQDFDNAGVLNQHTRFCRRLVQLFQMPVPIQNGTEDRMSIQGITEHDIIEACGTELVAVLQGEASAHNILFPLLEDHYRSYPFHTLSNYLAAKVVQQSMKYSPPLRILEVGAGTGSFTSELLSHVSTAGIKAYVFTDVTRAFFGEAKNRFSCHPCFETKIFDLEVHPASQGFQMGSFDIVIGSNCVHAVKDVSKTLRHLNWLLRDGGLLALVEVFQPELWQEFVFGTLPGWWSFEDSLVRPSSLLLDQNAWEKALSCAGFGNISTEPVSAMPARLRQVLKEGVVTATKTISCIGSTAEAEVPVDWCQVLSDDASLFASLSTVLQHHGVKHVLSGGVETCQIQLALDAAKASDHKCIIILDQGALSHDILQEYDEERRRCMQKDACLPLLTLLQQLSEFDPESLESLRIVVMTRSAQCLPQWETRDLHKVQPLGSLVIGMCRSAVQEMPSIELISIDLDSETERKTEAVAIAREIVAGSANPEVAYRRSKRLVRRISSGVEPPLSATMKIQLHSSTNRIRSDATYIVTGSSGGLGQLIIRHLLQHGARHILCLSRSRRSLTAIELPNTSVSVCVDIADFQQLSAAITEMRAVMPPFCAVFHAAGTLSDGTIRNQSWDTFETVLRPKVDGTINLLQLLAADRLDQFILFSSIVGTLGNAGQLNHAAACCFESTIAQMLSSQGQSITAIEWGPWSDIGAASSPALLARMLQKGLSAISPSEGLAALKAAMNSTPAINDPSHLSSFIFARVDWDRYANTFPAYARRALFKSVETTNATSSTSESVLTPESILSTPRLSPEFDSKTQKLVFDSVVKVLGLSCLDLPLDVTLSKLGLDSLSVMMLVRHLNRESSIHFRPQHFRLITESTIESLSTLVDEEIISNAENAAKDQGYVVLAEGSKGSVPIFMFHGAGGAVYMLQDLAASLSALTGRTMVALWPSGLTDDNYETDVDSLAMRYGSVVTSYCDGPYDFIGYSLGGGLAAACADMLHRDRNIRVQNLVMLDTPTPLAMRLDGLTMPDDVGRYLAELDPSLRFQNEGFEKFAKLFLHHCRIYKAWKPSLNPGIKHILFVKSEDRDGEWEPNNPEMDWIQLTKNTIVTDSTPGNHSTMLYQENGKSLANLVWAGMQSAVASGEVIEQQNLAAVIQSTKGCEESMDPTPSLGNSTALVWCSVTKEGQHN